MPLITFTGYPCSGKTKWAKLLQEQLEKKIETAKQQGDQGKNFTVTYHSDETLGINHSVYEDSNLEKNARGTQISAVKRDISRTNIIILDSLSYIKGFRYQLFCEAKGTVTPHCVVHVVAPLSKCIEWNGNANEDNKWNEELMKQLEMRYEEPNSDSRWDSPLFTLVSDDPNEKLPIDEIWDALVLKKAPPPNAATLIKPTSGNSFLQELDKKTQEVVSKIIQQQQISAGGDIVIDSGLVIHLPTGSVSTPQLQRIRRSYISLNRMRTIEIDRIIPLFVEYINRSLSDD
ncbi:KTI12 [[Candida] subhashii]|uniref:KTI12 n=1 Tax=[Candida] subhashii TaxID=561895 RepID=A0A8J5UMW2_9ASCO|nr:KTI12 [[Candida] subhashii]KAG7663481.1 KTI12 [[Candida] subhashii]